MSPSKRTNRHKKREYAVIDVGSSGIRMAIAEIQRSSQWRIVDSAFQPMALGKDVFTTGSISRETMVQCLQILHAFREMMDGWEVPPENVRVIATSALREANNRDTFIDQVAIRTGFKIKLVEGIEANQLTYLAVREALRSAEPRFYQTNSIIIEVGGGSTELMLMQRGKMVAAHTLHIGTVRVDQQLKSAFGSATYLSRFLQDNIRTSLETLNDELPLKRIRHFVAVGGDARLTASIVGEQICDSYWTIDGERFHRFVDGLKELTVDAIVEKYQIPYDEAEPLKPALEVYQLFFDATQATSLTVPNVSIRDGVLLTVSTKTEEHVHEDFYSQIIASASSLGRRYHVDERHSRQVSRLAIAMFDQLRAEHGLDKHDRLLLEIAGLLHDIGTFVNPSEHHKHGQYIVEHSEIFGLRPEEIQVVANVVRYHRRALPRPSHPSFVAMPREDRVTVMKLAALLRVADGLDRGHRQRVKHVHVELTPDELLLHADHEGDISLARFAVASKGDMFEEVFGLKPVLI